jgi:hypothetical protein
MRFLIVLALIIGGVAVLGFYRGWFQATSDNSDDKTTVTLTVDKKEVDQDKDKALEKVDGLGH